MSKWIFLGAPCLTCLTFLAAGALSRPTRTSAATDLEPFLAQPLPLDQARSLSDLDGARLLDRALGSFRDVRWLKVTIWQRLHDADDGYESEAHLILGPDQCARMQTTLRTGAGSCNFLVVSDGKTLAEVLQWPNERLTTAYLPLAPAAALREQFLRKRGCVGPQTLLTELRDLPTTWRVEPGLWRERSVLRLEAALDAQRINGRARSCRLYLDAISLWPVRLGWHRGAEPRHGQMLLEMEFRDPELNRALSREECARVFSYQP